MYIPHPNPKLITFIKPPVKVPRLADNRLSKVNKPNNAETTPIMSSRRSRESPPAKDRGRQLDPEFCSGGALPLLDCLEREERALEVSFARAFFRAGAFRLVVFF